jgi:Transposase DDE domain
MPYKERLKTGASRKREKTQYKIVNWSSYNQSLRKRGMISLYFPEGDINSLFINKTPYVTGDSGQYATYLAPYIQLLYTLYRLFGWGIRQITGFIEDLWKTKGLDIPVPSFGRLCDLFSRVSVEVKQFCNKLSTKLKNGEAIDLIADSTGLAFGKASNWYETKYNKPCTNRPWKKMHISMDLDTDMHALEITDYDISDIEVLKRLIPDNIAVDKLLADGGYYSIEGLEELHTKGITPVIPPPKHAIIHNKDIFKIKAQSMPFTKNMVMAKEH